MGEHTRGRVFWFVLSGCNDRIEGPRWRNLFLDRLAKEAQTTVNDIIFHNWPEERGACIVIYTNHKPRKDKVVALLQRTIEPEVIDVREAERKYALCKKEHT